MRYCCDDNCNQGRQCPARKYCGEGRAELFGLTSIEQSSVPEQVEPDMLGEGVYGVSGGIGQLHVRPGT